MGIALVVAAHLTGSNLDDLVGAEDGTGKAGRGREQERALMKQREHCVTTVHCAP